MTTVRPKKGKPIKRGSYSFLFSTSVQANCMTAVGKVVFPDADFFIVRKDVETLDYYQFEVNVSNMDTDISLEHIVAILVNINSVLYPYIKTSKGFHRMMKG